MAEEPYIPRDLMGVPIPEDALLDEIRSRHGLPMHLQSESTSQSNILPSELISGSAEAFYAPETSTPTQTASSAGVSGVLNVDDLLQLQGRYSRGDTEYKIPENIKRQFGVQNPEFRNRGYEGTVRVKTSDVLDGIAPDWMTLDEVSLTYGQGRNRSTDPAGGVHKSGTRARGVGAGLSIGDDLRLAAEYMERGLYDDPNRQFSASATHPVGDGRVSGEFRRNINPDPRQEDETYVGGNVTIPFQEGGIVLPNPPKPDNSQAERSAINRQQYLEDEVPPGEEWPDEKYLAISELLDRSVLPGGERDPLLNPDRPRTVDGEPVPVTDAEYMMREAGRFPNRQNPLALIGRDATLEKTATTDMRNMSFRGSYTPPEHAYENLSPGKKYLIRRSDRPELLDDPGGSVITAAETFDEEFGPQVIVEGTPTHEWMHAGLGRIRQADPDFKLPQFPSEYGDRFSDNLNEEMWVRLIHAHTEDLSAIPMTEPLTIDGEEQFDDDGFVRQEIVKTKTNDDKSLLKYTGGDTDYWLSQPSAIRGINSILEKANEVGRELGSFAVTETPADRVPFGPGGQRRYEGTEISARQPFQEGGIASLPKNPVLGGQQHMLAYITPEEASTLRAQGGGVTPTGGQYRGPGGIASFWAGSGAPGHSSPSGAAAGGGGTGSTSSVTGYSPYGNVHATVPGTKGFVSVFSPAHATPANVDISSMMTPHKTPQLNMALSIAENNAKKSFAALANNNVPQMYADLSRLNPNSMAYASLRSKISEAMGDAVSEGFSPGAISKANQIANMNVKDALGNQTLALTLGDQEFDAFDIANMSDAEFSALSANPNTGVKGDPESPLGTAVLGLGTTGLGMLSPALSLPATAMTLAYGLTNPEQPSLGLMGLAEQALGTTLGEVAGDVSQEMGFSRDPLGLSDFSFTGYIGDQFDQAEAVEAAPPATDTGAVQGQETVYGGRPSNLGPGISLPPIPSVDIGLQVPPTATETLEDATSSFYDAQRLADATGVTLAQAEKYLASRYPQQLT